MAITPLTPRPAAPAATVTPAAATREPRFLSTGRGTAQTPHALFPVVDRSRPEVAGRPAFGTATGRSAPASGQPGDSSPDPTPPEPEPEPVAPVPTGPGPEEFAERIAAAVSALRLTSERLAEAARADTVELAVLLARRLVESELAAGPEPLFALVRSVIRKVGTSRRVVVRLCVEDAARVEAAGGQSKLLSGLAMGEVEIAADSSLSVGDCVIDADWGTVDGRLAARYEELRRVVDEVLASEEHPG